MKVLWFTNVPLEAVVKRQGNTVSGTGFWMHLLTEPLRQAPEITRLGVVWAGTTRPNEPFEANGVDYYTVLHSRKAAIYGIGRSKDEDRCLSRFVQIIDEFKPDLIHIHGTERFYGLLKTRHLTSIPTVISIQGLMGPCAKYAWGDKNLWDVLKLQGKWDAIRGFPSLRRRSQYLHNAKREKETLQAVDGVIGRTEWDRSYTWSVAPDQKYFHVDEMMRSEFSNNRWSLSGCNRHQIYTSGRLTFAKGMHTFLEAMVLLKCQYSDLAVNIAGTTNHAAECRYLQSLVDKLGLNENVNFLGWIPGSEIIGQLQAAHVYVNPSFIENSPNSVCEAMLMGAPSVCSAAGGIPSLLTDKEEGLLVRPGDAFLLAFAIRKLFEDDKLAAKLGQAAKIRAANRHTPQKIMDDLLNCYGKMSGTTS